MRKSIRTANKKSKPKKEFDIWKWGTFIFGFLFISCFTILLQNKSMINPNIDTSTVEKNKSEFETVGKDESIYDLQSLRKNISMDELLSTISRYNDSQELRTSILSFQESVSEIDHIYQFHAPSHADAMVVFLISSLNKDFVSGNATISFMLVTDKNTFTYKTSAPINCDRGIRESLSGYDNNEKIVFTDCGLRGYIIDPDTGIQTKITDPRNLLGNNSLKFIGAPTEQITVKGMKLLRFSGMGPFHTHDAFIKVETGEILFYNDYRSLVD